METSQSMFISVTPNQTGLDIVKLSKEKKPVVDINKDLFHRVRPRFFDQVGHQTTNASIGNEYFFTK